MMEALGKWLLLGSLCVHYEILFFSEGWHKIACIKIEETTNDGLASFKTMYISYCILFVASLFSFLSERVRTNETKKWADHTSSLQNVSDDIFVSFHWLFFQWSDTDVFWWKQWIKMMMEALGKWLLLGCLYVHYEIIFSVKQA